MARASDLSPAQVGWTSEWYLRHDTLEPATGAIVDYQSTIGLAQRMGSGEHSSSDGKRRIVSPDSQQARALPRYFGRDRGLTHYTFVSDQHTHFATRVIRTTVRDATYVLDGILLRQPQPAPDPHPQHRHRRLQRHHLRPLRPPRPELRAAPRRAARHSPLGRLAHSRQSRRPDAPPPRPPRADPRAVG